MEEFIFNENGELVDDSVFKTYETLGEICRDIQADLPAIRQEAWSEIAKRNRKTVTRSLIPIRSNCPMAITLSFGQWKSLTGAIMNHS